MHQRFALLSLIAFAASSHAAWENVSAGYSILDTSQTPEQVSASQLGLTKKTLVGEWGRYKTYSSIDVSQGIFQTAVTPLNVGPLSFPTGAGASITYGDYITFYGGYSLAGRISWSFEADFSSNTSLGYNFRGDSAGFTISLQDLSKTFSSSGAAYWGGQRCMLGGCQQHAVLSGELIFPIEVGAYSFSISMNAGATAGDGTDSSHSLHVSMNLPQGVTYTTIGGDFLTPVPEPTTAILMTIGLFGVCSFVRRS